MSESTEPEQGRVDPWTTDPIAVSLRASIDDGRTAFRDLAKVDRHALFEAKTLDIWTSRDGARRLERAYQPSRHLPPDLYEPFHPAATRDDKLMLRLLCTRPILGADHIAYHDDLNWPDARQINYLPFVPASVDDLWHQWGLPREWTWLRLNAREVGNFTRTTEWDFAVHPPRAKRLSIAIHFPFVLRPAAREDFLAKRKGGKGAGRRTARSEYNPWRDDPFIWSFAMSHSLRDGQTRGVLDGLTDWAAGDVARRMLTAGEHGWAHPLHLPTLLLDIFFQNAAWEVNRLCIDVARFEDLSRDARVSSLERYDAITTSLRYVRRALDFQQRLAHFLLDTRAFLETTVFARGGTAGGSSSSRGALELTTYETYVYETSPHLEEKLTNTLGMVENNLQTCDYLQARSKDALDFINGSIALRDQASNRDDADSNKTMSMLQMTFLPATFVAAIMSINVFDFTQDPPVVYASFWLFWLVSALLTITVLGLYFGVGAIKKRLEKRQEAEAQRAAEQDRLDLVRPPGGAGHHGSDASGAEKRGSGSTRRRRRRDSGRPKPEAAPV